MTKSFILDASVTMSWFLEDEIDVYGEQIKTAVQQGATPVVPALWAVETTHVVLRAERRQRLSAETARDILTLLKTLPVEIDDASSKVAFTEGWALAEAHQLSVYEAMYLELAIRRGLPVASLDAAFQKAAGRSGVPLFLKA